MPEVIATDPVNRAKGVHNTIRPKGASNTELDLSTVNAQNVRPEVYHSAKNEWRLVASTPTYDQDSKSITGSPAGNVASQKEYRVSLATGIQSSTGGRLASSYSWSFTIKR
jgi:Bacterial Ig-like domain